MQETYFQKNQSMFPWMLVKMFRAQIVAVNFLLRMILLQCFGLQSDPLKKPGQLHT